MRTILAGIIATFFGITTTQSQTIELVVQAGKPGAAIRPDMYGVFFEDINFAADGGLYAELVKNRSFDFTHTPLSGWTTYGPVEVRTDGGPFERNPHYVRLTNKWEILTGTGLVNEGFRGIGIKENESYRFSFYARSTDGVPKKIKGELTDSKNNPAGGVDIEVVGKEWKKYTGMITGNVTDAHCRLNVGLLTEGVVDLEHISLFPVKTWKNRENGMRPDIAQALADLKPGVLRFPGGCIVEGNNLATRYQWKNTLGPVENRPVNENRWNYEFKHKFFPDYFQSYGLGFFEFFLLAEDWGAEPLPVVSCGFSCQFQTGREQVVPLDSLQPYIDDALDLIAFANAPVTDPWGKIRAEMGHPAPFNLKYLAIGNEQWGELYHLYLEAFMKQIRPKYPQIKLIGTAGPSASGEEFDRLWPQMKALKVDLVDEHYYMPPQWFLNNAKRYDTYDRKGPKVFAGEYAAHTRPTKKNSFEAALAEAAFLTGIERNADIVHLATYAPLLAHVDAWQWNPDLIWFDNLSLVKSVNYYVQQLYSHNKGDHLLPLTRNGAVVAGEEQLYASAVTGKQKKEIVIKLANTSTAERDIRIRIDLPGKGMSLSPEVEATILSGDIQEENTLAEPQKIVPVNDQQTLSGQTLSLKVKGQSFNVYRIKYHIL
ncbi:MAG: carbohydrate binding domain-containing protein [Tannerellaceae bacterium]|jgi:alpha-L-arabinofuranosidase|nr:carbohydrate binding domain-containing protein [Tannerellaceae bacterium]